MSNYGKTIEMRLQEMVQEDEGATIRIGELEHKLRLAEQMPGHIYGRYRELSEESNVEQSELHAMNQKMENMSNELRGAIGQAHQQTQNTTAVSTHAQTLNSDNEAMRLVADQLQRRMFALQDENMNMWKIAELEQEELQSEQQQQQQQQQLLLLDEMSQASASHNHEKLVIDHLRAHVAALRANEHMPILRSANETQKSMQSHKVIECKFRQRRQKSRIYSTKLGY